MDVKTQSEASDKNAMETPEKQEEGETLGSFMRFVAML